MNKILQSKSYLYSQVEKGCKDVASVFKHDSQELGGCLQLFCFLIDLDYSAGGEVICFGSAVGWVKTRTENFG